MPNSLRKASCLAAGLLFASMSAEGRALSTGFLLGGEALGAPVPMSEFATPADARPPAATFTGTLRLEDPAAAGGLAVIADPWGRLAEIGEPIRHLPEFEFRFVQRGTDLVPLVSGVRRRRHPYWEIAVQPGRVWNEDEDGGWTRATLPFALSERAANCTHNGVMTWLFNDRGAVSRVAYQVASETCGYFKFDLWGVVAAGYRRGDAPPGFAAAVERLDAHRQARLPVRPLARLSADYPGVDAGSLAVADGIRPDDLSVYGMVVDGIHYRSDCPTRHGPYPFCDELALPSYSTAKSIFAGVAAMRLERLYPGTLRTPVAALVDECDADSWRGVTLGDLLDMASGHYLSRAFERDENSEAHKRFVFAPRHADKIAFACRYFPRRTAPGRVFVYHTSDSYLLGTALGRIVRHRQGADADLYRSVLLEPLWRRLHLSELLDETKRSYDDAAQPFTGYGLTYESDDVLRIARWLRLDGGRIAGEPMLDEKTLAAALFRSPGDPGVDTGVPRLRYNNGFWAYDAGPDAGCRSSVWVPFLSGVSGITVALFPNGVIYYYFSDGYVFSWKSARIAAHSIRSLCP